MDQSGDFSNTDISELLKTSKQVQNKMRQELSRQALISSAYAEEGCKPTWNDTVPSPYLKNVVAEYLLESLNLNEKPVQFEVQREIEKTSKRMGVETTKKASSSKSLISNRKNSVTVSKKMNAPTYQSSGKNAKSKPSTTNQFEYRKSSIKPSVSATAIHRFPLQRFAGTSTGNIDFSKEHPDLQLDSFSSQTLFPRRFRKGTETSSTEKESLNLAEAKTKPPDAAAKEEPETWNEVLSNNRTTRKPHRVMRLKVNVADVESTRAPKVRQPKGVDIISTPGNGLFQIEKDTERLLKQSKCNLQSFPVMYIRPEYQVQRVANISIRGDNRNHNPGANVKYVEYKHDDDKQEKQALSPHIEDSHSPYKEPETHTAARQVDIHHNSVTPMEENKYFKALRIVELPRCSSESSATSSPTSTQSSRRQSSTMSASKAQQSSSLTTDNDVDYLIENMLSSSDRPQLTPTKKIVKKRPTQREVHVQTDHTSTDATIPPPSPRLLREAYVQTDYTNTGAKRPSPTDNKATTPLPSPPTRITNTFKNITHPPTTAATTKQANDNFITDDNFIADNFINKIFDRILNDVPNALQAFKNRNATLEEAERHPSPRQIQEQAQTHQHQVSRINDTSNAEIEPRLSPVLVGAHSCSHPLSDMPPTARSPLNEQSMGDEGRRFLLLQQNPLFVQTINKIKSSAVHDAMPGDDKIKDDRHKCPTDAEIKRAVRIFLDSLALEARSGGDGVARKSITKGSGIKRRSINKYISTDSSHTSSSAGSSSSWMNRNKVLPTRGGLRSSTSTTISSLDLKTESDSTGSLNSPQFSRRTDHSLSDGEVLSIGEV